jgi:hypothetical protein
VRRPLAASKALGLSPLVEARRANSSRIEGIPLIAAGAEPFVFLAGRPAAERAADARWFGLAGLLIFLKLAVWNDGWMVGDRIHDRHYALDPDPPHPSAPSKKHRNKALTSI